MSWQLSWEPGRINAIGDANVSLQSSLQDAEALCVLAGWEMKQITSGQELVMRRRMQKRMYFNPVFTAAELCRAWFDSVQAQGMSLALPCHSKLLWGLGSRPELG